jgi:hypothetical protein
LVLAAYRSPVLSSASPEGRHRPLSPAPESLGKSQPLAEKLLPWPNTRLAANPLLSGNPYSRIRLLNASATNRSPWLSSTIPAGPHTDEALGVGKPGLELEAWQAWRVGLILVPLAWPMIVSAVTFGISGLESGTLYSSTRLLPASAM